MKFKLGADPELFMADATGILRASCGKIGGSKIHPAPLGIGEGFFIQEDNVAVEFNIPPSESAKAFKENMHKALTTIITGVKALHNYEIVNLSAAVFPAEELTSPQAKEFGCDPDYNAWTRRRNPRPKATDAALRSCGGHVHVGYEALQTVNPFLVVKAMDLYLGVPSVLMDQGELRKQLYGKAGACRVKPYGVEYRTLSNFWVFNEKFEDWVWNSTERALNAAESQSVDFDKEKEEILTAINTNDKALARKLAKRHKLEVVYA